MSRIKNDELQNVFCLYGEDFSFNEGDVISILLHKEIIEEAFKVQKEFHEECAKKVHNFDELFTIGFEIFSDKLEKIINKGASLVSSCRKINISSNKFLEVGMRSQTLPINDVMQPLTQLLDMLNEYIEKLGITRDIERSSRSQWQGGGFGIEGALWGAAKASVLNYITDSIRGVSDYYTDQDDLVQIQKLKDKMYNENCVEGMKPINYYESILKKLGYGVYLEACNMLELDSLDGRRYFADEVLERIDNCYPVKCSEVLKAIYNYPFYSELYFQIFLDNEEEYSNLTKITNYVGITDELNRMVKKWFVENKILPFTPKKDDHPNDAKEKINQLGKAMSDYEYLPLDDIKPLVNSFKDEMRHNINQVEYEHSIMSLVEDYLDERDTVNQLLENNELEKLWKMTQTTTKAYIPCKLREYYNHEFLEKLPLTLGFMNAFQNRYGAFFNDLQNAGINVDYILAVVNCFYQRIQHKDDYIYRMQKIKLAEKGDLFALGEIGRLLIWPNNLDMYEKEKNENKGVKFIVKAANALDPWAMYFLGKIYRIGYGSIKHDIEQSKLWLRAVLKLDPSFKKRVDEEIEAIKDGKVGDKVKKDDEANEGCFITSAVCEYYGKSDNCYELTMFRNFRDGWLINQPDGKELIDEYYEVAPIIVEKLSKLLNARDIYEKIWKSYLLPCLKDLENSNMVSCKKRYKEMVLVLKNKYLNVSTN